MSERLRRRHDRGEAAHGWSRRSRWRCRWRSKWRGGTLLGLALLLALVGAACSGSDSGPEDAASADEGATPVSGGKVVFGISQDPDGLNPAYSRVHTSAQNILKAIYDPIAVVDEDGAVHPYLVESIEPNDDFTEWTITMRDGITFHNGDPLTPQALATHLKAMQLSPLTSFTFGPIDTVAVIDEAARPQFEAGDLPEEEYDVLRRQVVVLMEEPWSTFPTFLANFQVGFVAHPDYLNGEVEEPIGTGPFVVEEWVVGDRLVATRNDDYWRDGLPYLDSVEFRALPDPESRLQALAAGDIDLMVTNAPDQVAELGTAGVADDQVLIEELGPGDELMVMLNAQSGPTASVDVRRALQLATDREALNDTLYEGYFEIADTPYPSSSEWYTDPGWPEPDAEAAAALVEEWEAENGALHIALQVYNTAEDLRVGQALQAQWLEAGIETEVEAVDEATSLTLVPGGNYEAALMQFMNGTDPDEHFPFWTPENIGGPGELSINFSRYDSEVVGDALDAARRTDDPEARRDEYAKVWKDWADNAAYLFLYHTRFALVATDDVVGLDDFTTPDGAEAAGLHAGSIYLTEVSRAP